MSEKKNRASSMPFNVASVTRQSLLLGMGVPRKDLEKPMVGIITQSNEVHAGHTHFQGLAEEVKRGVREAGGVPVEINVGGFCDGIIMPNPYYTFPQRNLIVNMIEVAVEANLLDAMVFLASCDKNVPAALMGAARTNWPSILVCGGSMAPVEYKGEPLTLESVIHSVGQMTKGEMSQAEFDVICENACLCDGRSSAGACSAMTTGTTMQILTEALGMCLPGNSSCLGISGRMNDMAYRAGKQIMDLWRSDTRPRDILTEASIQNAIKVCLAVGGSIHALYHIPAIAIEAGLKMDVWGIFDKLSNEIPTIAGITPNGHHTMWDYEKAGGTPALMRSIAHKLDAEALTVTGNSIKTYYEDAIVANPDVIHSFDNPWSSSGGVAILRGNLAVGGSVVRPSGILPSMMLFSGKAKVFVSEEEAIRYIRSNELTERTVMVIKYQGLKGAPGIRTLLPLSGEIVGRGIEEMVAVVTDGRFSGGARGCCIGLVNPEAAEGGLIALVEDGDLIKIDIPNRSIELQIGDADVERRRKNLVPYTTRTNSPYLASFLNSTRTISEGMVEGNLDRGSYKTIWPY
ncbi:MAG: dihydroxy-acid dehydratase [Deltaproteobacteria bacterium]|nr:dihydroxy-acid dehydratase [Deltaproteobacteria bacterium]